jgi:hypothetical protein
MDIDVTLRPTGHLTSRGELYDAFHEGIHLCRSIDPAHDACRELEERGISGLAHFRRDGAASWSLRMGTRWGARHRVEESAKGGPKCGPWKPYPEDQMRSSRTAAKKMSPLLPYGDTLKRPPAAARTLRNRLSSEVGTTVTLVDASAAVSQTCRGGFLSRPKVRRQHETARRPRTRPSTTGITPAARTTPPAGISFSSPAVP